MARNPGASVRSRRLNHAKQHGDDYQRVLTRYAIERLLFRLSQSEATKRYVLKGAMLLVTWPEHVFRPTGDLDLLGQGDHVYPAPERGTFPSLLPDLPQANILMYPPETVVAEKFEAMIRFGQANGRVKDFHDIWITIQTFRFDLPTLVEAAAPANQNALGAGPNRCVIFL